MLSKNYISHVHAYLSLLSDLLQLIITVQVWKHDTMNTRTLCVCVSMEWPQVASCKAVHSEPGVDDCSCMRMFARVSLLSLVWLANLALKV